MPPPQPVTLVAALLLPAALTVFIFFISIGPPRGFIIRKKPARIKRARLCNIKAFYRLLYIDIFLLAKTLVLSDDLEKQAGQKVAAAGQKVAAGWTKSRCGMDKKSLRKVYTKIIIPSFSILYPSIYPHPW